MVQRHISFEDSGFTFGVVHVSICRAYLDIGNNVEALIAFSHADPILREGINDFWIRTLAMA